MPQPDESWQWQLTGELNTQYKVDIYDVDLVETPQETIDALHDQGKKVICYFSGGTWENYRDDADAFPSDVLGKTLSNWPDERWLDVSRYQDFAGIMQARLDLAVKKNCDAVEADNMDAYQNANGLSLTSEDQLVYNRWMANQAHQRGLGIGLKNDLDQVAALVEVFDFAINEQCFFYEECHLLQPFIDQGKAVFGVEYELEPDAFCQEAKRMGMRWLKMDYDLDGGRVSCDD